MVVGNVWRKRFSELEYLKASTTDDKTAMLRYSSDTRDRIKSCDLEGLLATPVFNIPYLYYALRVCCDEAVLAADAVHSN
jgi:hypothetical protein